MWWHWNNLNQHSIFLDNRNKTTKQPGPSKPLPNGCVTGLSIQQHSLGFFPPWHLEGAGITKSPRPRNPPRPPPDYLHLRCPQCEAPMAPESSLRQGCWGCTFGNVPSRNEIFHRNWENTPGKVTSFTTIWILFLEKKVLLGEPNVVQQFAHEIDGSTKFHIMHGMPPFHSITSSLEPAERFYPPP